MPANGRWDLIRRLKGYFFKAVSFYLMIFRTVTTLSLAFRAPVVHCPWSGTGPAAGSLLAQ